MSQMFSPQWQQLVLVWESLSSPAVSLFSSLCTLQLEWLSVCLFDFLQCLSLRHLTLVCCDQSDHFAARSLILHLITLWQGWGSSRFSCISNELYYGSSLENFPRRNQDHLFLRLGTLDMFRRGPQSRGPLFLFFKKKNIRYVSCS